MGDPDDPGPTGVTVHLPDGAWLHTTTHGGPAPPGGRGLTVVLVHGWTIDGRLWHRQIADLPSRLDGRLSSQLTDRLGDHGRAASGVGLSRLVAVDLRGHGGSGPLPRGTATMAQLADDLDAVISQLAGAGPVVLVGHSLGGMAIIEHAHRHPARFAGRVAGVVLVGSSAEGALHTRYGLPRALAEPLRWSELGGTGLLARFGRGRPPRPLARALAPAVRWLVFGDHADPAALRLVTEMVASAPLRSIGAFRSAIERHRRVDALAAMRHVPVTALVGSADRLTPPVCADTIRSALAHATLAVVPGAGHMLPLERPDLVTDAIAEVCLAALTTRRTLPAPADG